MLSISNTKVYDLKESVIAAGNAMRLQLPEYDDTAFEMGLKRCKKLAKLGGGSGHSNFRTGIRVSFDMIYPNYISPEIQRYHFFDIVTSASKMHRITKMDFKNCCNKYVTECSINQMDALIADYNHITDIINRENIGPDDEYLMAFYHENKTMMSKEFPEPLLITVKILPYFQYVAFMRIISNCPQGIELFMRCSTNYEQLATIYKQRRNHKLKEDWGAFCDWIKTLPYAEELIICEQ